MEQNKVENQNSMEYIQSCIDQILRDNSYILKAIDAIERMPVGDTARAQAVQAAVQSRETTHQRLIGLLEKMYDDLSGAKARHDDSILHTEEAD